MTSARKALQLAKRQDGVMQAAKEGTQPTLRPVLNRTSLQLPKVRKDNANPVSGFGEQPATMEGQTALGVFTQGFGRGQHHHTSLAHHKLRKSSTHSLTRRIPCILAWRRCAALDPAAGRHLRRTRIP